MSNTDLIVQEKSKNGELTKESINTLVAAGIVPKDTPPSQIKMFAYVAAEKGISPFTKEIYLVGYGNKYSVITAIDGFRKIAARTGQFAGTDDAKFDLKADGSFKTVAEYAKGEMPITCTITIYRIISGFRCPFTHTAKFSEFSSGQQKWSTMPFQMIQKVTEAFAIRKGFGDATSGISVEEEGVAIADLQQTTNSPTIILTDEQRQSEEDKFVNSETWMQSFKDKILSCSDYNATAEMGNKILKDEGYKNIVESHRKEFRQFVMDKLTAYQNAEA